MPWFGAIRRRMPGRGYADQYGMECFQWRGDIRCHRAKIRAFRFIDVGNF